jgi:hypothetical protein
MKSVVYLTSIISIIALAGLFIFKQPNGQAWLSVDGFLPNAQIIDEKINSATSKLQQIFVKDAPEKENNVKVYRWKDSNGHWSYSDKPQASFESEEMLFDPKDIIVLPAFDVSTIDSSKSNSKEKHNDTSPISISTTPNKVLDLYKDANNVQKLMDARQQKVSQAIKDNTG